MVRCSAVLAAALLSCSCEGTLLRSAKHNKVNWPEDTETGDDCETSDASEDCEAGCKGTLKTEWVGVYCESFMCNECCDQWCLDECDNLYEKLEKDGCHVCDEYDHETPSGGKNAEGSHQDEQFCKDYKVDFKDDTKDLSWEEQHAMSCAEGCKQCCDPQGDPEESLIQVKGKFSRDKLEAQKKKAECMQCMHASSNHTRTQKHHARGGGRPHMHRKKMRKNNAHHA